MDPLRLPVTSLLCALLFCLCTSTALAGPTHTITDAHGRTVSVPVQVERVICSGPGCLRLLSYLQAQERVVAVDDIETRRNTFDARPYALANPQFKNLPVFGEFRGHDNPERILNLEPSPQAIFKTYSTMGHEPELLQTKTGIPVIVLKYGNLTYDRQNLNHALRLMGEVLGKTERAEAVIAYFDALQADLTLRTRDIPTDQRISCYVGGLAARGPHGFHSTEPSYPPFVFTNARNLAATLAPEGKSLSQAVVAKEQIVAWDPDVLFLDLSTLQLGDSAGGLHELRTDPAYRSLTAVRKGRVFGVLPFNWYSENFGSIFADGYFVGKTLYPERFADVDPATKADEIYAFLVGKPAFGQMNALFRNLAFQPVPVK
ncbi:iron ABC transporter substrate-binding protein [Desulfocurvibacter africanus]|uniref:ABC-type transporter, periplasmic subunit n=1 Tax=Desulfocurvibacter africanus subsp. africanus str. Walvis Bay TaxID=690850 RepID=F3Z1L3_DESAF|nr:iron ABC transporter substrate-binding protein [Desulfocurvibacter africanus]EGJ50044.1 ABC-type transporter, periplasmic subunit [Desulfocurvibacter africanus subsp. africanus str. Walvis Bay]